MAVLLHFVDQYVQSAEYNLGIAVMCANCVHVKFQKCGVQSIYLNCQDRWTDSLCNW